MVVVRVVVVVGNTVVGGPHVGWHHHGAGAEDGLALVGKVSDVGELVAVQLEDVAQVGLLVPLTVKALGNISQVEEEHVNFGLGEESLVGVVRDLGLVSSNSLSVVFVVVLSLSDALGELENFETEGLDGDDLVGVDVELLLVALLVSDGGVHVEVMDSVVEVLRHDGAIVARGDLGGDLSLGGKVDGAGSSGEGGKSDKLHFNLYL